ncbi:MAG TPA: hypothetical protein VJS12_03800 [Steroidobacteraceae bacterium]|nr:hypothetical protein [Steroidobacteraceae bacterium]
MRAATRSLTAVAAGLWIISLALTALVFSGGSRPVSGILVLTTGWFAPLVALNFAWYANVFFLFGLFRAFSGRPSLWPALCAALLSLDTLRLRAAPLDLGITDAVASLYGYGWGVVLWFLAIFMLLIVSGAQSARRPLGGVVLTTGILLCILTATASGWMAVRDHSQASPREAARMSMTAFKRGAVCSISVPDVAEPMRDLAGPVEIVGDATYDNNGAPFRRIDTLLEWGIPIVRVDGVDYSIAPTTAAGEVSSVTARGDSAAVLHVSALAGSNINAKLVDASSGRTVFDHTWLFERMSGTQLIYCPEYASYPSAAEQPRAAIVSGLGIRQPDKPSRRRHSLAEVEAVVIARTSDPSLKRMTDVRWAIMTPSERAAYQARSDSPNVDCPEGVGLRSTSSQKLVIDRPFQVYDRTFYPFPESTSALCRGNEVVLFGFHERQGSAVVRIDARELPDFRRKWGAMVVLPHPPSALGVDLRTLAVDDDKLTLSIYDTDTGEVLKVRAPLSHP